MINGAHVIIFSKDAEADRGFFRDVLKLPAVDVGGGWLIFGLPPSEVAVHPSNTDGVQELYLICENVESFIAEMNAKGIACEPVKDEGWGLLTRLTLPGGGTLGAYQVRHARPEQMATKRAARPTARSAQKKPVKPAKAPKVRKPARKSSAKPAKRPAPKPKKKARRR
jgi:hypothetical protein